MSVLFGGQIGAFATVFQQKARGKITFQAGNAVWQQIRPTDSQGLVNVTLQNIVSGSQYRLEDSVTGALIASGSAPGGDFALPLDWYLPNKTVRVKVRKGTAAPYYKGYETLATIGANAQSIYIAQIPD